MQQVLVLGGGASGLAAALAGARARARVTVLERNAKPGKKLLATGNGRCNLDNTGIAPERYFTSSARPGSSLCWPPSTRPTRWLFSRSAHTRTDEAAGVPTRTRRQTCLPCWKKRQLFRRTGSFSKIVSKTKAATAARHEAFPRKITDPVFFFLMIYDITEKHLSRQICFS